MNESISKIKRSRHLGKSHLRKSEPRVEMVKDAVRELIDQME